MLKKNQLALILLTLIMMLTVYYIKSPFDKDKGDNGNGDDTGDVSGRMEQLTLKRLALKDTRKEAVLELDAIIASNEATVAQKNAAVLEKQRLNSITEKEILLELAIIGKGYRDAFVHATNEIIQVTIVADEHSASTANEFMLAALNEFEGICDYVKVTFQTAQEVMGNATE